MQLGRYGDERAAARCIFNVRAFLRGSHGIPGGAPLTRATTMRAPTR